MEESQQVTKEDQKYINEFSKLHQKNKAIESEIITLNEKNANYKQALDACEALFDEQAKILIGETFIEMTEEEAKKRIELSMDKIKNAKKEFEEKFDVNKKRLGELKIILYSKFGKSINLDE